MTKQQELIYRLSQGLPPLTDVQRQWAVTHCGISVGYACKGYVTCGGCGNVSHNQITPFNSGDEHVCPICGRTLRVQYSRKQRFSDQYYFTIVTTCHGYQVCRSFILTRDIHVFPVFYSSAPQSKVSVTIHEVVQNWISPKGREVVVARSCRPLSCYYDAWDFNRPMAPKRITRSGYGMGRYNIDTLYVYPHRRVLPIIKRNGYTARAKNVAQNVLLKALILDSKAEQLIKTKQYMLLSMRLTHWWPKEFEHCIRIATHHGYQVKDANMWVDYLRLIDELGKDTHNPKYILPRNLFKAHAEALDAVSDKRRRDAQRAEAKRKQLEEQRALLWEPKYQDMKGRYFGIVFGDDTITISVLSSVAAFIEEGEHMHHCVFKMRYYQSPDCLILSARDKDGNRIETVEVSLKSFKVVQSRGVCNQNTEYHDRIIELVNKNINLIKKAS